MAESQVAHRQGLENRVLNGKLGNERTGQWMAFALSGIAIIGAIVLMVLGKWGEGSTVLLTTVVTLAGIFVAGRRKQATELQQKAEATFGPKNPV